ncbi:MAG: hypothetical protein ACLFWG_06635 [Longimicrobiales bacterium]
MTTSSRSFLRGSCFLVLVTSVILVGGCATGFSSSTVEDFGSFRIDVTNDLAPRVEVHLQVDPRSGGEAASESLLGSAPVEGTTVFRVDLEDPSASHRLRASLPRDRELFSESFVPGELAGVRWDLADNALAREERGRAAPEEAEGVDGISGSEHRRPTGARKIPPGL